MKTAILFEGQGSHYEGMYEDFFKNSDKFNELIERASEISGLDIKDIAINNPHDILSKTEVAQPVLCALSLSAFFAIREENKDVFDGESVFAGHSLGEFAALGAAGVIGFDDCIRLVTLRGRLMGIRLKEIEGAMCALIYKDENKIFDMLEGLGLKDRVDIANYNYKGQVSLSGDTDAIYSIVKNARDYSLRAVRLKVEGPFHSRAFLNVGEELERELSAVKFDFSRLRVYSNATGEIHTEEDFIKNLSRQVYSPVRFTDIVDDLINKGVEEYVEIGSEVLSGFIKRTDKSLKVRSILRMEDI